MQDIFTWYMEATDLNGTVYIEMGLGSSSLIVVLFERCSINPLVLNTKMLSTMQEMAKYPADSLDTSLMYPNHYFSLTKACLSSIARK